MRSKNLCQEIQLGDEHHTYSGSVMGEKRGHSDVFGGAGVYWGSRRTQQRIAPPEATIEQAEEFASKAIQHNDLVKRFWKEQALLIPYKRQKRNKALKDAQEVDAYKRLLFSTRRLAKQIKKLVWSMDKMGKACGIAYLMNESCTVSHMDTNKNSYNYSEMNELAFNHSVTTILRSSES